MSFKGQDYIDMIEKYEVFFQEAVSDIKNGIFQTKLNTHYHRFKTRILKIISRDPSNYYLYPGCQAGRKHFTISPDGRIYLCPVLQFDQFDKNYLKTLENASVNRLDDCKYCWNKHFCGGGCYAMNYFLNEDITKHDRGFCELDKFLTEKSIYLLYEIINSNKRTFHEYILSNFTDDKTLS